ncbi:epstein-Barr nuclear antigen 1 [Streptomyces sp. SPB074]|nr:epstein-Barr nuclear antigen 1 [Streptomyces sp. SPB074]
MDMVVAGRRDVDAGDALSGLAEGSAGGDGAREGAGIPAGEGLGEVGGGEGEEESAVGESGGGLSEGGGAEGGREPSGATTRERIVGLLAEALENAGAQPAVRRRIAQALTEIRGPSAARILAGLTRDADRGVAATAAYGIARREG